MASEPPTRAHAMCNHPPALLIVGCFDAMLFVATSQDEIALLSTGADRLLRVWHPRVGTLLYSTVACAEDDAVRALAVERSSTFAVTGDSAGRAKVWDLEELTEKVGQSSDRDETLCK
eukprot:6185026-Pleurochrysis_carterae.AAC.1